MIFKNSQKGISLYLALIVLTLNLSIVLGITIILIENTRISQDLGYSVIAFYAADTGIETVMKVRDNPNISNPIDNPAYTGYFDMNNNGTQDFQDSSYEVFVFPAATCGADNFCVKSIGSYKETKRAIRVTY